MNGILVRCSINA